MKIMQYRHTDIDDKGKRKLDGKKVNINGAVKLHTDSWGGTEDVPVLEISEKMQDGHVNGLFLMFDDNKDFTRYIKKFKALFE